MAERKQCMVSFKNLEKSERVIRGFLLRGCDSIRFTAVKWSEFYLVGIKRIGGENDPKFAGVLKNLRADFIKKIKNNKKYNDLPQGFGASFEHYFYRLSKKLKELINKETLLMNREALIWGSAWSNSFYCFEDPTFYKRGKMIASGISHEPIIILYLTPLEREMLEKKGTVFD